MSEITATGIEALTVRPTFKTRYSEDAPKTTPNNAPSTTARTVSSGMDAVGETYGRKLALPLGVGSGAAAIRPKQILNTSCDEQLLLKRIRLVF